MFLVGAGLIFLTVIAYFLSEWLCECCRRWRQHKGHCSCSRRREVCTCLCIDKRSSTSRRSSSRPGRMCCWRKPAWAGACACDWILYPCPRVVSRRPTAANHGGTAAGTSTSAATDLGMVSPAQVGPLAQAHAGVPTEDFKHLGSVGVTQWYEVRWLCCLYRRRLGGKSSRRDNVVLICRKTLWVIAIGLLSAGLFVLSTLVS